VRDDSKQDRRYDSVDAEPVLQRRSIAMLPAPLRHVVREALITFNLLRCTLTHSGLVPTAAIAATSCAVVQRNIAVQYLTSRPSLILTRARSIRPKSQRSMPLVSANQPERSTHDVGRVRPMTVLVGNAIILRP